MYCLNELNTSGSFLQRQFTSKSPVLLSVIYQTSLIWLLYHKTLLDACIVPANFARCLPVSLNFLWWSWIAPANFATRLRVLPNFLCLSWIAPLNFDACLQVLLNFLWLSHISLLTFVSQNFVLCLRSPFNFRWWPYIATANLKYLSSPLSGFYENRFTLFVLVGQ